MANWYILRVLTSKTATGGTSQNFHKKFGISSIIYPYMGAIECSFRLVSVISDVS